MLYVKAWSLSNLPYYATVMGQSPSTRAGRVSWAPTVTAVAIRTIDHGPAIEIYAGAISHPTKFKSNWKEILNKHKNISIYSGKLTTYLCQGEIKLSIYLGNSSQITRFGRVRQ